MSPALRWYAQRLGRMTPEEISGRLRDRWHQQLWSLQRTMPVLNPQPPAPRRAEQGTARVAPVGLGVLSADGREDLLGAADDLLKGRWEILGVQRADLLDPDWSMDPRSGRRYPEDRCAFKVDFRSPQDDRNVKQILGALAPSAPDGSCRGLAVDGQRGVRGHGVASPSLVVAP